MKEIAGFLRIPESRVFSVATFYAQFRFSPIGKKHIMLCRGTACHVKNAPRILEELENQLGIKSGETREDLEYSLETVACIGACSLAPCIVVNDEVKANLTTRSVRKLFGQDKKKRGENNKGRMDTDRLYKIASEKWSGLHDGDYPLIMVGTATCGRSAGALDVLEKIREVTREKNIRCNIAETGCIGLCYAEPLVYIAIPGKPDVLYGNITPKRFPH
jgi:NADH:ubiquinone oxidoreductase subunit E